MDCLITCNSGFWISLLFGTWIELPFCFRPSAIDIAYVLNYLFCFLFISVHWISDLVSELSFVILIFCIILNCSCLIILKLNKRFIRMTLVFTIGSWSEHSHRKQLKTKAKQYVFTTLLLLPILSLQCIAKTKEFSLLFKYFWRGYYVLSNI